MALVDDIKAKGFWQTIIRPRSFIEARIAELGAVLALVAELSIQRRGWDFPHVDRPESTQIGNEWVGQETAWEEFREVWRVSRSGQFVHLSGLRYDWGSTRHISVMQRVEPGATLIGIGDSLHRMSEVFEFAQRWANAVAPTDGVSLSVEIGGLQNRQLVVDHPTRTASGMIYKARAAEPFVWSGEVQPGTGPDELLAAARTVASKLFTRFGYQANPQVLEDWQRKVF